MNAIVISAVWGTVMMFSGIVFKSRQSIRALAIIGLVFLFISNILDLTGTHFFPFDNRNMLYFESFGLLFNAIAFGSTLIYFLLSAKDIENVGVHTGEYYALIFFVLCGVSIVSSFNTLLMLFVGIEILSIPLYILTGSDKRNLKSNEASLKYFLMGSFSTGLMLLGIAFLYGASDKGTFFVDDLGIGKGVASPLFIVGLILLMSSMAFKVSAAPFHFWTPDVYDGAPTVFTSFMATIVKAAAFIAFIRLFGDAFSDIKQEWQIFVAIITATTLFIGNLTAVFQQSVKRMLAYSSIAQAGFMLLALLTLNTWAKEGIIIYVAAYSLATIGIFAVLIKMKDYTFDGFNGLAKHQPVLAAANTIFLLSLAGIPLTAGFFAKYYMLAAVLQTGKFMWLVIFAIACAAVSVYYYFRVIQAMYFKDGEPQGLEVSYSFRSFLIVLAIIVVLLGIFPQWLIDKIYYIYI
ncbi:MAG: NADH-quinone oxidoreductase subunit F [Bacteroidetes bacterium]|nr:MAG: NADH-quinone oxidoreductase subunit F [Bacteroidota bacterium]